MTRGTLSSAAAATAAVAAAHRAWRQGDAPAGILRRRRALSSVVVTCGASTTMTITGHRHRPIDPTIHPSGLWSSSSMALSSPPSRHQHLDEDSDADGHGTDDGARAPHAARTATTNERSAPPRLLFADRRVTLPPPALTRPAPPNFDRPNHHRRSMIATLPDPLLSRTRKDDTRRPRGLEWMPLPSPPPQPSQKTPSKRPPPVLRPLQNRPTSSQNYNNLHPQHIRSPHQNDRSSTPSPPSVPPTLFDAAMRPSAGTTSSSPRSSNVPPMPTLMSPPLRPAQSPGSAPAASSSSPQAVAGSATSSFLSNMLWRNQSAPDHHRAVAAASPAMGSRGHEPWRSVHDKRWNRRNVLATTATSSSTSSLLNTATLDHMGATDSHTTGRPDLISKLAELFQQKAGSSAPHTRPPLSSPRWALPHSAPRSPTLVSSNAARPELAASSSPISPPLGLDNVLTEYLLQKNRPQPDPRVGDDTATMPTSAKPAPLARWRRELPIILPRHSNSEIPSPNSLHPSSQMASRNDARTHHHQQNRNQQQYQQFEPSWLRQQEHATPVANRKVKVIEIPNHDLSIADVSLLFREKTMTLKRSLRSLGEIVGDWKAVNEDTFMVSPDQMELVAEDLQVKYERSLRAATSLEDREVLMKRRAAAEAPDLEFVLDPLGNKSAMESGPVASYEDLPPRPPVVCIMGHVDHGKTTLMDAFRQRAKGNSASNQKGKSKKDKKAKSSSNSNKSDKVAGTEAGGITQVVSAFQVPLEGQTGAVTFLDTPGHAAFKAMRQSGSEAADIIVLVVAADDGVSPQTEEILNYYKSIVKGSGSGGISLVVAMNKIDKPGIDVDEAKFRIQNELSAHGILTEGLGGSEDGEFGPPVQLIPVSGLTGAGLDDLIEGIALQSEIMNLRAEVNTRAEGIVLDARIEKGLGVVVNLIIRWGSLEKGDILVCGQTCGKVRLLKDVNDQPLSKGLPSQPVRMIGFESIPKAGEAIVCVASEEAANELVARRQALAARQEVSDDGVAPADMELQSSGKHMMNAVWKSRLETKYGLDGPENVDAPIRIPIIVKADADGTLAAVKDALIEVGGFSTHNILVDPVIAGVGPVLATELLVARESGATIFCFNVRNEGNVKRMAEEEGVNLVVNDVIYRLIEEAKTVFAQSLPPRAVEIVHGKASVLAVFDIGGLSSRVAGLRVNEGKLYKDTALSKDSGKKLECGYRVIRDGVVISSTNANVTATSLKIHKEDKDEVGQGTECGLSLSSFNEFEKDDVIECFSIEMKQEFV